MTAEAVAPTTQRPVLVYALLLRRVHELIARGKGDTEEADALADLMDAPWYAMSSEEQARMRGLSSDLYALREGGPKRVQVTPEQLAEWKREFRAAYDDSETGNIDGFLNFLRRPIPAGLPAQVIPFLQARCWDKLGDLETALLFMREAERYDPEQAFSVLVILRELGRTEELPVYAERVIDNRASSPLELYLAGVALIHPTQRMGSQEASPLLRQAVPVLRRAISEYLALPAQGRRENAGADLYAAQALGLCLERLGDVRAALSVYNDALARYPRDAELLVARGLAHYGQQDMQAAFADFTAAVRHGAASIYPYLMLARRAAQSGAYGEALRLALAASEQPGSDAPRAEAHEIIAIAMTELGQPREWVQENFDRAIALDPKNGRIRENRALAVALPAPRGPGQAGRRRPKPGPLVTPDRLHQDRGRAIDARWMRLNEQHGNRSSGVEALVAGTT